MTTSRYELLYIIPTSFTDEEVGTIEQKVAAIFTKVGATIDSTKRLGKFRLAYAIKKQRHGHYILVMFTSDHGLVAKLDELLRITSEVLRHLIIRAEEGGAEAKFDLVQFNEIVVEGGREDRRRREKAAEAKEDVKEEIKEGVAALVNKPEEKPIMSAAEVDAKIDSALSGDAQSV